MSQYTLPADGTSNSSGAITITFPQVAVNTIASGVVSVPAAPSGAVWQVLVNGENLGTMIGSTPFGTLQIDNTDQLQLTGTGVLPSTQYSAQFIGAIDYGTVPSAIPTPQATAVLSSSPPDVLYSSTVNLPASGSVSISGITMPAPYQSIMVVLENSGTSTTIAAEDSTSGGFFGFNGPIDENTQITGAGSTFIFAMVNEPGDLLDLKLECLGNAINNAPIIVFGVRAVMAVQVTPGGYNGFFVNTGIGQNLDVLPLGGASTVSAALSGGPTQILAAPAAGTQYRLHRAVWRAGTAGDEFLLYNGSFVYSVYTPTTTVPSLNDNMDGVLCSSSLSWIAGGGGGADLYLAYDVVQTQEIG